MAGTPTSLFVVGTTAGATIQAADPTNFLYMLRGYRVYNTTASATTWSLGKSTTPPVAATAITLAKVLAANETQVEFFPGGGEKIDNQALSLLTGANTAVNLTLYFDKIARP